MNRLISTFRSWALAAGLSALAWGAMAQAPQPPEIAARAYLLVDVTAGQVRELMGKGFAGTVFLTTDDCIRDYDEMSARGVEFSGPPEQQMYGIDTGFRDPSGNHLRLTQVATDFG